MENIGKILGPAVGVIFVIFILIAMIYLWRQGYKSEREMEKERADLEQANATARTEEETITFKAVPFDSLSQNTSPPPYTRHEAPRVPEPAVVRVTS
ncbi:hypothetical protein TWF481_003668 [Arthrobotrys musiformis]|uniref:Uncharacterized protein n=1 Tax=Arthrobotrys musiformis TaxID=47236 RepID=A0AAV9WJ53_9PEZI